MKFLNATAALVVFYTSLSFSSGLIVTNDRIDKSKIFIKETELANFMSAHKRVMGGVDAGGGDFIRLAIIENSENIQKYLIETELGRNLVAEFNISLAKIKEISTVDKIIVVKSTLIDRTGSIVDALVLNNTLYLNHSQWNELLAQRRNLIQLVFHELLRLAGYNDENYVISQHLKNVPAKYQTYVPGLNLQEISPEGSIKSVLTLLNPTIAGSGCRLDDSGTQVEIDGSSNTITVFTNDYSVLSGSSSGRIFDLKSCAIAIPANVAQGYRVRATQVDIFGEALGDKNGEVNYNAEIFWSGSKGPNLKVTPAIGSGRFLEREIINFTSPCGKEFIFRMNSSINSRSGGNFQDVAIRVSSTKIYFKVEKCQSN